MAEKGAEVIIETARLWIDVGVYDNLERFCINCVTGPDEYSCLVNNNFYTNQIAKHNLLGAAEIYFALKEKGLHTILREKIHCDEQEIEDFYNTAQKIYLPYDKERDMHAQDDSFLSKAVWDIRNTPKDKFPLLLNYHPLYLYRHQVCKQADTVLSHYLFDDDFDESTLRNSYNYYEAVTTHDSSLSSCVHSIMASRLGMKQKAYDYYIDTVRADLDNAHKNTKDGLHTANLGGTWLALVSGFAGMRLRSDGLHFNFTIPAKWTSYSFYIFSKGSLMQFVVEKESVTTRLIQGESITIHIDDKPYTIDGTVRLEGIVR
jgi:alpha,alpha-trehalose phosphorylase